jgi:hypothetical protein
VCEGEEKAEQCYDLIEKFEVNHMTTPRPASDSFVPFKASSSISVFAICSTHDENGYWAEESPPRGGHGRSFSTRAPPP